MTSIIERKVNDFCSRWLDGFTKDNVDVSLLQAKITLSDLHFKTDELCLLSPTFAPSFFYVGKLSVDIPLAFNHARPLKITVSDILAVIRVGDHENMTPEDVRKTVSANVHIRMLLSELASELGGGGVGERERAATISLENALSVHKIARHLEVDIKGAHIRLEERDREKVEGCEIGSPPCKLAPVVAFGVCLRDISLRPDSRANEGKSGGARGKKWLGRKFRKMETALLGNLSLYNTIGGNSSTGGESPGPAGDLEGASPPSTLTIAKIASVRGLSAYFCRDEEYYSATDREETLKRLKEGLKTPPTALPPFLRRCRAGLGLKVVLSAVEWGKIESLDVRMLAGYINVQAVVTALGPPFEAKGGVNDQTLIVLSPSQFADDQLEYLLKWASLLNGYKRELALSALRPTRVSTHPGPKTSSSVGGVQRSRRYYRALWRYAMRVVLWDLRSALYLRDGNASKQLERNRSAKTEGEHELTRAMVWRIWFGEWVRAARYLSVRKLLLPKLVIEKFSDEAGRIHDRLYEALFLKGQPSDPDKGKENHRPPPKLAKYLMPWELPQEHVDKAWRLLGRKTLRWETRLEGGIRMALDEERVDLEELDEAVLQALWSLNLQMDAGLPNRICTAARRIALLHANERSRIDGLWKVRAEKQRRLGLGGPGGKVPSPPPPPQQLTLRKDFFCSATSEAGGAEDPISGNGCDVEASSSEAEGTVGEEEDGADRVGTLLVRVGQLDGVGGVGLLSLAPKAIATLTLEESSASIEEMDMETNSTKVAVYDVKNERCHWDETFTLQVELDECYVQGLRMERMLRKNRRSPAISDSKTHPFPSRNSAYDGSSVEGAEPPNGRSGSTSNSPKKHAKSPAAKRPATSVANGSPATTAENLHRRSVSDSPPTTPQAPVSELRPHSSFLFSVSCKDTGLVSVTHLGTMTLPGKQLTAVSLKVLEHKCALFSPAAVGRQPRELTIQTIFVPPGENVALGEEELNAIGQRRRSEAMLDMRKHKRKGKGKTKAEAKIGTTPTAATPPLPQKKSSSLELRPPAKDNRGGAVLATPPSVSTAVPKPRRSTASLGNVGEHKVKVLSLVVAGSPGNSGSNGTANDTSSAHQENYNDQVKGPRRKPLIIPVVDTKMPSDIATSIRIAGVKLSAYINSSGQSLARLGLLKEKGGSTEGSGVVTLTEAFVENFEACVNVDAACSKVRAAIKASTLELLDSSLLRSTNASRASLDGHRDAGGAEPPQLLKVGPAGVDVTATYISRTNEQAPQSDEPSCPGDAVGPVVEGAEREQQPPTPTLLSTFGSQSSSDQGYGNVAGGDSSEDRFWNAWRSLDEWDWQGRVKLGAYTADVGKWPDRGLWEEVWRYFRFPMPSSQRFQANLHDTQVLRKRTSKSFKKANSSTWLLKAGTTGVTVDVKIPINSRRSSESPPPLTTYVYVSSSDDGDSDDEADSSPTLTEAKAPPPAPVLAPSTSTPAKMTSESGSEGEGAAQNRGAHDRWQRLGNLRFPSVGKAKDKVGKKRAKSREAKGAAVPEPEQSFGSDSLAAVENHQQVMMNENSRSDGGTRVDSMRVDDALGEKGPAGISADNIMRRVQELEQEVATLRAAAEAAATNLLPVVRAEEI